MATFVHLNSKPITTKNEDPSSQQLHKIFVTIQPAQASRRFF
jgi:hypothetical protein